MTRKGFWLLPVYGSLWGSSSFQRAREFRTLRTGQEGGKAARALGIRRVGYPPSRPIGIDGSIL
jgi:hypothetical protein